MRFLIDRAIDMTIRDHRWNSTAQGWTEYAVKDPKLAGGWRKRNGTRSREYDERQKASVSHTPRTNRARFTTEGRPRKHEPC
jgi:hypothetical protein